MSLKVDITKDLGDFRLDVAFEADNGITCLLGASGCGKSMTLKCIAGIEKPDAGHIELKTALPLRDDLTAIGIRAHYFNPATPHNRFPIVFAEEMEEPFETILQFRYAGQTHDSPAVWWRLSKDKRPQQFPGELGIAPVNVLPLYE